ncbi:MAG: hypothetical protein NTX00_03405 [Candidatus Parcubacteria bacterium]|nr:hypothetical protein [Candidatus Parcubacteria bacterium]
MGNVHLVLMMLFAVFAAIAFLHKYYKANVFNNQPQTPTGSFTEKFGKTQVILNIIAMFFGIAWFLSSLVLVFAR